MKVVELLELRRENWQELERLQQVGDALMKALNKDKS